MPLTTPQDGFLRRLENFSDWAIANDTSDFIAAGNWSSSAAYHRRIRLYGMSYGDRIVGQFDLLMKSTASEELKPSTTTREGQTDEMRNEVASDHGGDR